MKRTPLILLIILGLVLAAALGLALREFVGDTILMPILFIAWLAQLVFNSLPGWFWWAWFVIIAIIIAQRSLRVRPRDTERLHESRAPVIGPVQAWAERLRATRSRNVYFRWLVARDLADVSSELAEVLTLRHATQDEAPAATRSRNADLTAPPEIASYLRMGLGTPPSGPVRPPVSFTRPWRAKQELTPLDLDPEKVVAFLEGQLEGRYDD